MVTVDKSAAQGTQNNTRPDFNLSLDEFVNKTLPEIARDGQIDAAEKEKISDMVSVAARERFKDKPDTLNSTTIQNALAQLDASIRRKIARLIEDKNVSDGDKTKIKDVFSKIASSTDTNKPRRY
jgi:pyrroline-5-carboxylate reductase